VTARISNTRIKMTKIGPNYSRDYFTSGLYPFLFDDGMSIEMTPITTPTIYSIPTESVGISGIVPTAGTLEDIVITYDNYPAESLAVNNIAITGANLEVVTALVTYNNYPTESLAVNNIAITSANLEVAAVIVTYNNYPTESLAVNNIQIQSGTLT
jgi:hypothetical protein